MGLGDFCFKNAEGDGFGRDEVGGTVGQVHDDGVFVIRAKR